MKHTSLDKAVRDYIVAAIAVVTFVDVCGAVRGGRGPNRGLTLIPLPFNAVLAVRLAEGECLRDACIAANAAAAQSVAFKYVMPSVPRRPRLRLAK